MASNKVKYVQFEPLALLGDPDVQLMTAEEFGVYWRICCILYIKGGKIKYDLNELCKACKVNGDFDFQTVLSKFKVRRGFIYHKRVTQELRKAQVKLNSAVKAANIRWDEQKKDDAVAMRGQCEGNAILAMPNDMNGNDINNHSSNGSEKAKFLCQRISQILQPKKKDISMFAKMVKFFEEKNPQWLTDALEWLAIAKSKRVPIAYFIKTVQKETNWKN